MKDIEKCARLMFGDFANQMVESGFNPIANKSDLLDLECALGIDVIWCHVDNQANGLIHAKFNELSNEEWYSDHSHDKFTARVHAVVAVAVQIYDRSNP